MRLFIILIVLFMTVNCYANDILVTGGIIMDTGNVLEPGITITFKLQKPTNPNINDEYNDPRTGIVEVWNGSAWVVKNKTQLISDEIQIFKDNIESVSNVATKKCLKALGKAVLKLYKESL